jgi:hypothetical protein
MPELSDIYFLEAVAQRGRLNNKVKNARTESYQSKAISALNISVFLIRIKMANANSSSCMIISEQQRSVLDLIYLVLK